MSILARKTVINLQRAGLTQVYESSSYQNKKHVIDLLTQFAIHLHGRHQEVKKTSETKHSFLTFLICEIHGVFPKFSRKGLPYSKVGPPDLRYLISRECWHSAVNFVTVNESIVHFLDQVVALLSNEKLSRKQDVKEIRLMVRELTAQGRKTSHRCV